VADQERQLGVYFDTIIVCTVTGSTHAGMIAGFAALQDSSRARPRRILGIDASATIEKTRDQVARIARNTAKLIELGRDLTDGEITILEGWAGDLYGIPVDSTIEAIRLSGSLEGMIIDPVYEGNPWLDSSTWLARARSERIPPFSTPTWAASRRSTPTRASSTELNLAHRSLAGAQG
jgi:1-aminocyclopropane-1-carboxylate deaminase/D-cysteine desulfhydrase-like pyridoxal-dependent ACC family enzyme